MRIAVIGEGKTEFYCVPTIAGRLGNIVVGQMLIGTNGDDYDWEFLIRRKVVPRIFAMAAKNPDKILVVVDRERRAACPPDLAATALEIVQEECGYCLGVCRVSVVVCNRQFENALFADYDAVDRLPILDNPVSHLFPEVADERNLLRFIEGHARDGAGYEKDRHGLFLARQMRLDSDICWNRSRTLRKLVKELTE